MREIKFRAWDKEIKEMWSFELMERNKGFALSNGIDPKDFLVIPKGNDIELMQYTGLKDKNGTEIYEGDIIIIPDDYDIYGFNAGEKYQIYFAFGSFRLKPKYRKGAKGFLVEESNELEVLGNIHENPELLNDLEGKC